MNILLDIDGVLVITPNWKPVEQLEDGFMKFDSEATKNLIELYNKTNAHVILTSSHRIYYDLSQWKVLLLNRGLNFESISMLEDSNHTRAEDIENWVENNSKEKYIIIDDDSSINGISDEIKKNWVRTMPLIGFNQEKLDEALRLI